MNQRYRCIRCAGWCAWSTFFGRFLHLIEGTHDFVDHDAQPLEAGHPSAGG